MSDPHGSAGGEGQAGRNLPPLRLHVPEPPARPGEAADFTHFDIPAAGAQPRPDETAQPGEMRDMAYGLVRVLDEEGRAQIRHIRRSFEREGRAPAGGCT